MIDISRRAYADFLRIQNDTKTTQKQRSYIFHKWLFSNWDSETLQFKSEQYATLSLAVRALKSVERFLFCPFSDYIEESRAARDVLQERQAESKLATA